MGRTAFALGIGLIFLLGACGDDDDDPPDAATDAVPPIDAAPPIDATPPDAGTALIPEVLPDPLPTGDINVTLVTYNAGLIQLLKYGPERLPLLIEAVKGINADVVCMQEVWLEYTSHIEFAAAVVAEFPHSYWSWTGETSFGNGILILSKHPIYRGRELFFQGDGGAVDRIILGVDVVTPDEYFHFLCTHLEAFESTIQQAEIDKIAQWIVDEGYDGEPTFMLGDFNTGPFTGCAFGTCVDDGAPTPAEYFSLLDTWDDAATGFAAETQCTYCREFADPLQLITPLQSKQDDRIDGCMYRDLGATYPGDVQVILGDLVSYEAAGETRMTQRSDHRGVECMFTAD